MADLASTASSTTSTANQTTNSKTTTTTVLNFTNLNNALATHNAYKVGEFLGSFLIKVISVEVPTYDTQAKNPFPYEISGNLKNMVDYNTY